MLYPQTNTFRQVTDLSGFWHFCFDDGKPGRENGFDDGRFIAVPASWNDIFEDGRDNLGPAWYQTHFHLPWGYAGKRIQLRFGSVNYLADVWLNGRYLGQHEGGHLPFTFDVTDSVTGGENLLVVRVDGRLAFDQVPPGNVTGDPQDFFGGHHHNFPPTQFDFFPFCGIQRPVLLTAVPHHSIEDITVTTDIAGSDGVVTVAVAASGSGDVSVDLVGFGEAVGETVKVSDETAVVTLTVPHAKLWSPDAPNLYDLTVTLKDDDQLVDSYTLPVGIRTIAVQGSQLLLNGEPIYLTGFGRHEDFPIHGRGLNNAVIIKDYALMKWIGANSFRTTHYPYSDEMMMLADKLGFLIIDEIPAVGLYFREDGLAKRLEQCRQQIRELIARDKNHASVIMWSIANEPHSDRPEAVPFFQNLTELTRTLDASRPVTLVSFLGVPEASFAFLDVVCFNRYLGWYENSGRLEEASEQLAGELDALHEKFGKPIILTEFGTDTIPGSHAQPPEMFSEEYQAAFLTHYIDVLRSKPFVVGEHVWNLCDFKTSQAVTRMGGFNYKGVFTRDRRPKLAAHRLREIWQEPD
jgi:beta-glucuronidase